MEKRIESKNMKMPTRKGKKKVPMLHLVISFIPWIFYWFLINRGSSLAIILALILVLAVVIPQIRQKYINLMDATTFIYFCIATVGTFALNSQLFINYAGVLAHSALFLMASISLIIRQPFTLQIAKRNYPQVYWENPMFLKINYMLTGVWTAIFLSEIVIYAIFGQAPLFITIQNILTLSGIIFSMVIPRRAAAYFTNKMHNGDLI